MHQEQETLSFVQQCITTNSAVALLTVISSNGASPGKPGMMMAVKHDRSICGTVGGGGLEFKAIDEAVNSLETGISQEAELHLAEQDGAACGGTLRLFIRVFQSPEQLIIIGAGHVGQELYRLASQLDFRICVVDDRPDFLSHDRFQGATLCGGESLAEALAKITVTPKSYITIASRSHECDQQALETVLNCGAAYIGMIGSRGKIAGIMKNLENNGASPEQLSAIFAPMGLDISSANPREIAFSILSEILLVKNSGSLNHMRELKGLHS